MICVKDGVIRITRGDTGTITIRVKKGTPYTESDRVIFEAVRDVTRERLMREVCTPTADGEIEIALTHELTREFLPGTYMWDVRVVLGAEVDEDGSVTGGTEIVTPFEARRLVVTKAVGEI